MSLGTALIWNLAAWVGIVYGLLYLLIVVN